MKKDQFLYKLVLTALFSALAFGATYIHIPLPTGFIHLGNFVCIIAALLAGGIVGGISGALGMGIYDLIYYGGFSAGVLRTLILKFLMGFIAGALFRLILKKKFNTKIIVISFLTIFTLLFGLTLYLTIASPFKIGEKNVSFHVIIPIFTGIITLLYLFTLIFHHFIKRPAREALAASSVAIAVNIFGEIFLKAFLYYLIETKYDTFEAAYIYSISGIPSVIITSTITLVFAVLAYQPLYYATKNFNKINDVANLIDDYDYDDESKEKVDNDIINA